MVLAHLARLLDAGVRPVDVGVITPYNGQVALLRELRPASLTAVEIDSVDGFQGGSHWQQHALTVTIPLPAEFRPGS